MKASALVPIVLAISALGCGSEESRHSHLSAVAERALDEETSPSACSVTPVVIGGVTTLTVPSGCNYLKAKMWGEGGFIYHGSACLAPNDLRGSGGGAGFVEVEWKVNAGEEYRFYAYDTLASDNTGSKTSYVHQVVASPPPGDGYTQTRPIALAAAGGWGGCALDLPNHVDRVPGRGGAGGPIGQDGTTGTATYVGVNPPSFFVAGGGKGATATAPGVGGISNRYSPGSDGFAGLAWGSRFYWIGGLSRVPVGGRGGDGIFGGGGGAAASLLGDAWGVGGGGGGGSNFALGAWNGEVSFVRSLGGSFEIAANPDDPDRGNAGDGATNANRDSGPGRIVVSFSETRRTFEDVPEWSPYHDFIETIHRLGITSGCAAGLFCPTNPVLREQMAVFLLRANDGPIYTPPPAQGPPMFLDVTDGPYQAWIEEIARRQVTSGCGGGNYCPRDAVTRAQMAVFLLRTKEGALYSPPPAQLPPMFADVSGPFQPWIEEIARRGITSGCGTGIYCPTSPVTREQMAVFLVRTFNLSVAPAAETEIK